MLHNHTITSYTFRNEIFNSVYEQFQQRDIKSIAACVVCVAKTMKKEGIIERDLIKKKKKKFHNYCVCPSFTTDLSMVGTHLFLFSFLAQLCSICLENEIFGGCDHCSIEVLSGHSCFRGTSAGGISNNCVLTSCIYVDV